MTESPASDGVDELLLATVNAPAGAIDTVSLSEADTELFEGSRADAVAVLATDPASTSDWLTVYVAGHVNVAAGARVTGDDSEQEPIAADGSDTDTFVRVTLPLLVTTIE